MHGRTKTFAGLAAILLCGAAWFVSRGARSERAAPPDGVAPDAEQRAALGVAPNEVEAAEGSVDPASSERRAIDAPANSESKPDDDRLRGRVTDASGAAIAGARVVVVHNSADSFSTLDAQFARQVVTIASDATDARGEFAFEVPHAQLLRLDVSAAGFGGAHVPHCKAGEVVNVQLRRSATLFGRVTRRADDSPVAGAVVSAWPRPDEGELPVRGARTEATTDGVGRYRLEGLAPGRLLVDVAHAGDASPRWPEIELAAGEAREQDFALEPGETIRGHVTDARTGAPIAGAQICQGWTFDSFVTSDAEGAYEFKGFSPGYLELDARARGYGRTEIRVREPIAGVTTTVVDFALTPAGRASGRVVDENGAPIAGAYVAAAACEFGISAVGQRIDWSSTSSGADGAFALADLRADLHHTLFVRKERFGTVVYEFPADEAQRAAIELGDITLPPAASVLGRVVDTQARPIANQLVQFRGSNRDRARFSGDAPLNLFGIDLYVTARETRTDGLGQFRFDDIAPGEYALSASIDLNHERAVHRDVGIERGATLRDIELVIDRGLSIRGVVRVKDGGALPHVYVSVDPQGEGASADCEVASGRFEAQGLSATTYSLTAYPYPSDEDKAAGRLFLPTVLEGVAAGARDVAIELLAALVARGRVLDADGRPVSLAPIVLRDARGRELAHSTSLQDGTFEITVPAGERFDLEAQPPQAPIDVSSDPPPDPSTFATLANLSGGDTVFELRLNWRP